MSLSELIRLAASQWVFDRIAPANDPDITQDELKAINEDIAKFRKVIALCKELWP